MQERNRGATTARQHLFRIYLKITPHPHEQKIKYHQERNQQERAGQKILQHCTSRVTANAAHRAVCSAAKGTTQFAQRALLGRWAGRRAFQTIAAEERPAIQLPTWAGRSSFRTRAAVRMPATQHR